MINFDTIIFSKKIMQIHTGDTVQDLIKELLREKVFEDEPERFGGISTCLAIEGSLARSWLSQEENEAWAHMQKET